MSWYAFLPVVVVGVLGLIVLYGLSSAAIRGLYSATTSLFIAGRLLHPASMAEVTSSAAQLICRRAPAVPNCLLVLNSHILQRLSALIRSEQRKLQQQPLAFGLVAKDAIILPIRRQGTR
jgi:hypothetical protein